MKSLEGDFDSEKENTVMIGDTYFDARGARQCGIDFIGVEYGYGSTQTMKDEGAALFAKTPNELLPLLIG